MNNLDCENKMELERIFCFVICAVVWNGADFCQEKKKTAIECVSDSNRLESGSVPPCWLLVPTNGTW